jgi:uncharacterized Fe-S cluster-containing radical SAM superfamily enzyme
MTTFNEDPNFSIVAPGGCNANCSFCFAKDKKCKTAELGDYLSKLCTTLSILPKQFYQISITGGEPLLSPYIIPILSGIFPYKKKYTNVLLTTNGTNLLSMAEMVSMSVDHINISRHHYDEYENKAIFGGSYDIMDNNIVDIIDAYSKKGIDISANCVINDSTTKEFIESYIKWARDIGFKAVRFRKENGKLEKTPVEKTYKDHKVIWSGKCPVCRTDKQVIHGFDVFWKSSVLEPSTAVKEVFEVVFAPDGDIYQDWAFTQPVVITEKNKATPVSNYIYRGSSSSCGVSSSRC